MSDEREETPDGAEHEHDSDTLQSNQADDSAERAESPQPTADIDSPVSRLARLGNVRERLMSHPRAVLAVVLAIIVIGGGALWWSQRGLPSDVAVRVGDTDITISELRSRMSTVEALYGVEVPEAADERNAFWRDAAHSVAVGLVLEKAAADSDLSVSENQVDQSLQQVIGTFFGEGKEGSSAFEQALANSGTSEQEVRQELRRQLEINALFADVTGEVVSPTDEQITAAYAERRCSLRLPEQRRLRNIVVTSEGDAREALRRLRAGSRFEAVVAALSIDASTRGSGGDLGFVARSDLEKEYGKAAFEVKKGGLYGPVRSEFGWNIGQVESIRGGRVPSLAEATEGLRQALFSEEQSRLWRQWLRSRLKGAEVEYAEDYKPKDPLALPSSGPEGMASEQATATDDC